MCRASAQPSIDGIKHPCLPKGAHTITYGGHKFVGAGEWRACRALHSKLFDTSTCRYASCSFGGEYQPSLPEKLYGFSYFYDRTVAIGLLDGVSKPYGSQKLRIEDMEIAGEGLCALGERQLTDRFRKHPELDKAEQFCGDVAYISALLRALGFASESQITVTNKIKDVELVWTLGAMLAKHAMLKDLAPFPYWIVLSFFAVCLTHRRPFAAVTPFAKPTDTTLTTTLTHSLPQVASYCGCFLFTAGRHQGKHYSTLDQLRGIPPAKSGHESD